MEDAIVQSTSIEDILDSKSSHPVSTKSAWLQIQKDCPSLRRVHAHLKQGTCPSTKLTNICDVKGYLSCSNGYCLRCSSHGQMHSAICSCDQSYRITRSRKIFELHLACWASNPQILLARGIPPHTQAFKLIYNSWTQEWKSNYRHVLM